MSVNATARNILIVVVVAALVAFVPGGSTTSDVIIQAVSLIFLGALAWVGSVLYRQHRVALYALGDGRRAALYAAVAVLVLAVTARSRMWSSSLGSVAWLVLVGGALYVGFTVVWAARKY